MVELPKRVWLTLVMHLVCSQRVLTTFTVLWAVLPLGRQRWLEQGGEPIPAADLLSEPQGGPRPRALPGVTVPVCHSPPVTVSKLLDSGSPGLILNWAYSSAYLMALLC